MFYQTHIKGSDNDGSSYGVCIWIRVSVYPVSQPVYILGYDNFGIDWSFNDK